MVAFTQSPDRERPLMKGGPGGHTSWWQMPGELPILLARVLLAIIKAWALQVLPSGVPAHYPASITHRDDERTQHAKL